jgi:hypothetical protein
MPLRVGGDPYYARWDGAQWCTSWATEEVAARAAYDDPNFSSIDEAEVAVRFPGSVPGGVTPADEG